jgi:HEPN domain-containing protein
MSYFYDFVSVKIAMAPEDITEYCKRAEAELERARQAEREGNHGMARVCARRAVGAMVEAWVTREPEPAYGTHTMSALRGLIEDTRTPPDVKVAANRLQHGIRAAGTDAFPQAPIEDANTIIAYLRKKLGI